MGQVCVVGLDIAKSVFRVHGIDRDGRALSGSASRRVPAGTIGRASCARLGAMSG
jgi:hypothetical protein